MFEALLHVRSNSNSKFHIFGKIDLKVFDDFMVWIASYLLAVYKSFI